MPKPLELVLIGAGNRGQFAYAPYALRHPEQVRFVAVAEPDPERRARFAADHDIDSAHCFAAWEELLAAGQLGQGAIVATQDRMHVEPATAAMAAGYDVLLEKPMAHTLAGCVQLVQTAERLGRTLQICHVLRYSPFWQAVHRVVTSGWLGDIVTVEQRENVAYWHMAHSFVRGNWRNQALASPMILAKCCHDLDTLCWNLGEARGARCERLSSVGSLLHYRADRAAPDIPARCTDGCPIERTCPFSAIQIYLEARPFPEVQSRVAATGQPPDYLAGWPFNVIANEPTLENRRQAILHGPYGRCVYRCDNDVVDHQIVTMEWSTGVSAVLVMHGHSDEEHRSLRFDGTKATLHARFGKPSEIRIYDHGGGDERVPITESETGHGGGDAGIMLDFVRVLRGEAPPQTSARASLESHLMAFAAEEARLRRAVVEMSEFRTRAESLLP